ncbi:hypothetical protein ES702_00711 [subsurface metagenome]
MKVFITMELKAKDLPNDKDDAYQGNVDQIIDLALNLISDDIPTQLKITNLPPRKLGFRPASELTNIEE